MSQEIDRRVRTPQPPSNMTVRPDNVSMCALSVIINLVGWLSILAGIILGSIASTRYSTEGLVPVYIVGGILSGIFNFALAVIVDACQKYRKNHKG